MFSVSKTRKTITLRSNVKGQGHRTF